MTQDVLTPLAEKSEFRQTGGIEEVERLSRQFAAAWPEAVRSIEYGRSVEGRPLRALIVSRSGALTPEELRVRNIPVLMLQAPGDDSKWFVVEQRGIVQTFANDDNTATKTELINMGIPGTNPDHYLALMVHEGLDLRPDLVLVSFFIGNDFSWEAYKDSDGPGGKLRWPLENRRQAVAFRQISMSRKPRNFVSSSN